MIFSGFSIQFSSMRFSWLSQARACTGASGLVALCQQPGATGVERPVAAALAR
jgi:hypothetical protein